VSKEKNPQEGIIQKGALSETVENPLLTVESFDRQFQISEKERDAPKWEGNWRCSRKISSFISFHAILLHNMDRRAW
jgi:hypothetical protein